MHESGARLLPSREDSDDRDTVGTKNSDLNAGESTIAVWSQLRMMQDYHPLIALETTQASCPQQLEVASRSFQKFFYQ